MAGIQIPVGAKADDRSFREIGQKAERFFESVGKGSGAAFTKDFADAVNQSSPQVQRAFDKIRDSIGQVTTAQAKLEELQAKGAGNAQLIAQSERLEKARRAEARAINEARDAYGGMSREVGALQSSLQGFLSGSLSARIPWLDASHIDSAASALGNINTKALAAATGVGALGVAAAAVGKQFYDLGAQWDDISDSITMRTGKVGDDLKGLTDVVGNVGKTTAAPLGSIGDIVGQLSQLSPSLAANNTALTQMSSNLAYLGQNGEAVNIRELEQAFNVFGVNAADQVTSLDRLAAASRETGIPLNELISTVRQGAPQFKQFGLDIGQSTGLLASFQQAGLDPAATVNGLRKALQSLSTDSRGAAPALADVVTQIKALHDANQEGSARQLAMDTFGARNFAPFLEAIEQGTVDANSLKKALDETGMSLAAMQSTTDDGAQSWQKLTNQIKTDFKPAGDVAFAVINSATALWTGHLSEAFDILKGSDDKLASLKEKMADLAGTPIDPNSALGHLLLPAGGLPGTAQQSAPLGAGTGLGANPDVAPNSDFWGFQKPDKPKDPKLPDAPVVPYDTTLPSGYSQLPQTSAIVGAEQSWMDARHAVAEKQARLNQLEQSNVATADDIQKAKNDVVNAEQARTQADLRLADARQSLIDKQTKQAEKQSKDLGEIGAQLDNDLGISKGLAGIADNLTRFLANLAAAPLLGQLAAIRDANPSQGGYGLTGIMGAQGAFGPDYTGIDTSKQDTTSSSKQVAVLQPGGGVGYTTMGGSGAPYGLPGGTDTGGYGTGTSSTFPPWVMALANAFNVKPSTYSGHQESDRHEAGYAPNPTHENRGIDWSGAPQDMQRFADYLKTVPGMEQVIWNGGGVGTGDTVEIAGGRPQPGYFAGDLAGHGNHVHTRQSQAIPLPGGGIPTGDSSAAPSVFSQASSGGTGSFPIPLPVTIVGGGSVDGLTGGGGPRPAPAPSTAGSSAGGLNFDALAQKEAGGDWGNKSNPKYRGGLQFDIPTWNEFKPPGSPADPADATKELQIAAAQNALNSGRTPASLWPQNYSALGGTPSPAPALSGGIPAVGGGQAGGPGPSMPIGGGLGSNPPVGGPGQGPTPIGGVGAPQGVGGGGVGMTPGGSLDTAVGMAASGLDMLAPGAGQAAQTGIKLANRAIQYAGQVAGIGVSGLMETFLPTGGSQLAQNSWFTRLAGGLAGAHPTLPNVAGDKSAQNQPVNPVDPNTAQHGQGQGQAPGPVTNINVTNQRATEDGTGRDIAFHQQQMYSPAGMP